MVLHQPDRRALEISGWRTTLEYRENHVRAVEGTLVALETWWTAEAEHADGRVLSVQVMASTPSAAWGRLRSLAAGVAP
jgi:hypothetical protein